MIKEGMKVFAYQADSERTDIATVVDICGDNSLYEVIAECGDRYWTYFVCPIGRAEEQIKADAINECARSVMDVFLQIICKALEQ